MTPSSLDWGRIGIITGLTAEAKLARRLSPRVVASGGRSDIAADLVAQLIAEGAEAILSFGIAGGLSPALSPGQLIVALSVHCPDGQTIEADHDLRAAIAQRLDDRAELGPLVGRDKILASLAEKVACAAHGIAVDMESHIAARAAVVAGLPFAAIRSIADPASRALPRAALVGLNPDGSVALGAVLASIAKTPGQIPALLRVARDTKHAMAGLVVATDRLRLNH